MQRGLRKAAVRQYTARLEIVSPEPSATLFVSKPRNILDQLDASIRAIETHRGAQQEKVEATRQQIDACWEAVLTAAAELRPRVTGHAHLRYFTIARDRLSITVSFHASGKGGRGELLLMSREHPEGKYPATQAVWVREASAEDRRITDLDEAVECLVRFCARNLARG